MHQLFDYLNMMQIKQSGSMQSQCTNKGHIFMFIMYNMSPNNIKQARQIEQESGTLMHIQGTGEQILCLEQLYGCLFQPLYTVHL